jgi:hypothetical protein
VNIPTDYSPSSAYDLLKAASRGLLGLDKRLLHALVDDPSRSLPGLVRFAAEDHADDPLDLEVELLAVFRFLKTPEALPFYLKFLRAHVEETEDDLIEGVIALGAAVLDPLVALYEELGEEQGGEVAFILSGLGVRDERVLKILLERLEYDPTDGGMCLGLYGDPAAIGAIEKMKLEVPAEDAELRRELQNAIDEIRSHGADSGDAPAKFDLFDGIPETAGPDFDALSSEDRLKLLAHESAEFRAAAAGSFFQQEFAVDVRARLLEMARADSDAHVRARAWEALAGLEDKDVRAEMVAVLVNPQADPAERGGAAVALADDADKPAVHAAIIQLYDVPEARAKAMEAMWRSFDRGFSSYFPAHLDDADEAIRRQAIFGVGYLGIGSESERLRKYFDDEDWRPDALYAWALSTPAEITRGRIKGLLRKIDRTADGLSAGETELVQLALDQRLLLHGLEPVFFPGEEEEHVHDEHCDHDHAPAAAPAKEVGRNDPCPCGSGKKFKKCCGA